MSTMTADDLNSVLQKVQEKLIAREKQSGISLAVSREASRQEDDWLYVVVSPSRDGIRAYDYVSTLGQVERELREASLRSFPPTPATLEFPST